MDERLSQSILPLNITFCLLLVVKTCSNSNTRSKLRLNSLLVFIFQVARCYHRVDSILQHSVPVYRNLYMKRLVNSLRSTLLFLVLTALLLFWIYRSSAKSSISPTSVDCKQSLIESDGYLCEPDLYWNQRKDIFHTQDKINQVQSLDPYFFSANWEPTFHCTYS